METACTELAAENYEKVSAKAVVMWASSMQSDMKGFTHKLNMELDLQSLFGLHVHSSTHWLRPRNSPPSPAFGLIYEGAKTGLPR